MTEAKCTTSVNDNVPGNMLAHNFPFYKGHRFTTATPDDSDDI